MDRQARTDGAIAANRATTPLAATNGRATKRLSIAELNAMDMDTLREKFLTTKRDERGPVQRFFDLLDLPRNALYNTIGSVVAPEALARKRERGEVAAAGLADVHFGDILEGMGVKNHVIRGVLGFAGDVVTDPLFYVGGVGGVAKMIGAGGKSVEALSSLTKAARQADEAFVAGGRIADAGIARYVKAAITPELVAAEKAAGRDVAGLVRRKLLGDVETVAPIESLVGRGPAEFVARGMSRVSGSYRAKGGDIVEYFGKEGLEDATQLEIAESIKEIMAQHGRAAAPGIRIGRNKAGKLRIEVAGQGPSALRAGTQVAHLPLTNLALQVSPLTAGAKKALSDIAIATGGVGVAGRAMNMHAVESASHARGMDALFEAGQKADTEHLAARNAVRDGAMTPEEYEAHYAAYTAERTSRIEAADKITARLEELANTPADVAGVKSVNDMLAARKTWEGAEAKARLLRQAAIEENVVARRWAVRSDVEAGLANMTPEAAEAERARRLSQLSDPDRELAEMTNTEAAMSRHRANMIERQAAAWKQAADSAADSIRTYADTAGAEALEIANRALDTDSDIMGAASLMPLHVAAQSMGAKPGNVSDRILRAWDRLKKDTFGDKTGETSRQLRVLRHGMTTRQREAAIHAAQSFGRSVAEALDKAGLDTVTHLDGALKLAALLAVEKANGKGWIDGTFWAHKFGDPAAPAGWVADLKTARDSGLLANKDFAKAIDEIADSYSPLMRHVGDSEVTDNILRADQQMPGYVGVNLTPEADAAISRLKERPLAGLPAFAATAAREQFQRSRTMAEYRFQNKAGEWRRFWDKDIAVYNSFPNKETRDAFAAKNKKWAERFADYEEWRTMENRPAPRQTDPFTLNQLYNDRELDMLTGGVHLPRGFADTNLATMIASRMAQHEREVARESFARYFAQKLVSVNPGLQAEWRPGNKIVMPGGYVATVRQVGSGPHAVIGLDINGDFYRPLHKSVRNDPNNIVLKALGFTPEQLSTGTGIIAHDSVARAIEEAAKLTQGEESLQNLLRYWDGATAAWKGVTLFHPSWMIQNIVGDSFNHFMGGARVRDFAKHARFVVRVLANAHDPEALRSLKVTLNGVTYTGEQIVEIANRERLLESNLYAAHMLPHAAAGLISVPPGLARPGMLGAAKNMKATGRVAKLEFGARKAERAQAAGRAEEWTDTLAAGAGVMTDRMGQWVYGPWMRLNQKVANSNRILSMMSHMEQGSDAAGAAAKALRSGFDHADLTRVERGVFRRMFPFYAWMRNNMAYQARMLMERPVYAASFPKLRDALEEMAYGDEVVPMNQRPGWLNEQLAMQVGANPDSRSALMLSSLLPLQDAYNVGASVVGFEGMQNLAHYFGSSLNPLIRAPLEIGAGREIFSGRSIGADPMLADIGPGAYATGMVRPIREAQRVIRAAQEQGPGAAATRAVIGGRAQPFTDKRNEQSRVRDYKEEEGKLRLAVRRAENKGDKAGSVAARARLLRLYAAMEKAGLSDEVPAWARQTLQEVPF